jgi:hypothetical protein
MTNQNSSGPDVTLGTTQNELQNPTMDISPVFSPTPTEPLTSPEPVAPTQPNPTPSSIPASTSNQSFTPNPIIPQNTPNSFQNSNSTVNKVNPIYTEPKSSNPYINIIIGVIIVILLISGATAFAYFQKIGPFALIKYSGSEIEEKQMESVASTTLKNDSVEIVTDSATTSSSTKNSTTTNSLVKIKPTVDDVSNINTMSAVLDLPKKYNTEGKTLCTKIPSQIGSYKIVNAEITNEITSDNTHSTYWDTTTGKLYSINVDENIVITYSNGGTKPEDKIAVEMYRFINPADLDRGFGKILGFITGDYSTVTDKSGVVGYKKYINKKGNSIAEVTSKDETTIKMIGNALIDACYKEPVFKTSTPAGFVKTLVSDIDYVSKEEYAKIADSDLTLYLDQNYFGIEPFLRSDEEKLYGQTIANKVIVYDLSTVGTDRKMRPYHDVNLFVMNKATKAEFMDFMEKYDASMFTVERASIGEKIISQSSGILNGNPAFNISAVILTTNRKDNPILSKNVSIFFIEKGNTLFAFMYQFTDMEVIQSVLDNVK